MTVAEYVEAVQALLHDQGMDWHRPAGETPTGRAFTNMTNGITLTILSPDKLTAEEREDEVKRLREWFARSI